MSRGIISLCIISILSLAMSQDCSYGDLQPTENNTDCSDGHWLCKNQFTGLLCNEVCENKTCDHAYFQERCDAPLQTECRKCKESNYNVIFEEGEEYRERTAYRDLLNGSGSFEHSKVGEANKPAFDFSTVPTKFNDVLFSTGWWGWLGTESTGYKEAFVPTFYKGEGARGSTVLLNIPRGASFGKEIQLREKNTPPGEGHSVRGLRYSFWVRGPDESTVNVDFNVGISELDKKYEYMKFKTGETTLSYDTHFFNENLWEWREVVGYIDLIKIESSLDQKVFFRIDVTSWSEIMIDELRVFPSWVKNSRLSEWSSQVIPKPDYWVVEGEQKYLVRGEQDNLATISYAVSDIHIKQFIDLSYFPSETKFPLQLELEVEYLSGSPTENDPYLQVSWETTTGEKQWVVHHNLKAGKHIITGQIGATGTGGTLKVSKRVEFSNAGDKIKLHRIVVYSDPESCLVKRCSDESRMDFWNNECTRCSETVQFPPQGFKFTTCTLGENGPKYDTTNCDQPKKDYGSGTFLQESEDTPECTFKCKPEFWFDRVENSCKQCKTELQLQCDVGKTFSGCSLEADATCKPCGKTTSSRVQYVVGDNECDLECRPGYFFLGNDNRGSPICLPCSQSVCGAADSFRHLPGLQKTTECTSTSNSRCEYCISEDPVQYIASAFSIGTDCDYNCTAGFQKCENKSAYSNTNIHISATSTKYTPYTVDFTPELSQDNNPWVTMSGYLEMTNRSRSHVATISYNNMIAQTIHPALDFQYRPVPQRFELNFKYDPAYEIKIETSNGSDARITNLHITTKYLISPLCEKQCKACPNLLPGNATWSSDVECEWTCSVGFIPENNECRECRDPGCSIGKYWSDCGTCSDCPEPPKNASYISSISVFNNTAASCITDCDDNFYSGVGGSCTECSVPNCSSTEFTQNCTIVSDGYCQTCSQCLPGYFEKTPCSQYHDSVCERCTEEPPFGAHYTGISECHWDCAHPYTYAPELGKTCTVCFDKCSVGFYFTGTCSAQNNYTGCEPCESIPENATFTTKGLVENSSKSCLWNCDMEDTSDRTVSLKYNQTSKKCESTVKQTSSTITRLVDRIQCASTLYDRSRECARGYYFQQTNDFILNPVTESCGECVACPPKPITAEYLLDSCNWDCVNPFIKKESKCRFVRDLMYD